MSFSYDFLIQKLRIVALLLVTVLLSTPAPAAERIWTVYGTGSNASVADCNNCDEDIGIVFSCLSGGRAELLVPYAAVENGKKGAKAPVVFIVDRERIERDAVIDLQELIGYLPRLEISLSDPLIARLSGGYKLKIEFAGQSSTISLRGSRRALETFVQTCSNARD